MKFTKDEIRRGMLLYAVTDQSWLKEGQTLLSVCEDVLANGATFLQIREKDLDADSFEAEAAKLKALCARYGGGGSGRRKSRCGLHRRGRGLRDQHQEKRPESDGGKAERNH